MLFQKFHRCLTFFAAVAAIGLSSRPASGVVWRDDLTDAVVIALAKQGQFGGVGIISLGGTGIAIAPGWVLTARHVVGNNNRVSFQIGGVSYAGTSVSQAGSDVALIRLDANRQLPASTVFIAPNPSFSAVNELVWKVGFGQYSSISNTSNLGPAFQNVRAGTNVINAQQTTSLGPSLVFNNSNTNANSTRFEVSTAPGDSGGPMFLQRNNQWYVAGVTTGAESGVGFTDANVAAAYSWITSQTGSIFAPQAAPIELRWDGNYAVAGVQTGPGSWHVQNPTFESGGFNYTWENDFAPVAVFGTAGTGASLVTVDSVMTFGGIRFAPVVSTSGPFQILDGPGSLTTKSGGSFIDSQAFARFNASIAGSATLTKTGTADLIFDGDNSAFSGQIVLQEGTTIMIDAKSLGTASFNANTKTTIGDGATLQLRGTGLTTNEHFHVNGTGFQDKGAIYVSRGDHVFTERLALQSDSTIHVDAGTSLTFGGSFGQFYNNFTLTQSGDGTVVYDRMNTIEGLIVESGIIAGMGGINGNFVLGSSAEIRPGDSATVFGLGTLTFKNATLDAGSLLRIDANPMLNTADMISVSDNLNLAGQLSVNLLNAPTLGDTFRIFDLTGTSFASGMFANLNRVTSSFMGTEYAFDINYRGGTGNDILLTAVAVPEPSTLVMLAVGILVIAYRRQRNIT